MALASTKVAEGIQLCIENAEVFLSSSVVLFENKKIRDSHLLCLYALEEMGKVPLIFNLPFHSDTPESVKKWKKRYLDHDEKFHFSRDIDDFKSAKLPDESNRTERKRSIEKQSISYVSFQDHKFEAPTASSLDEVKNLIGVAKSRLDFLKKNHPSVESDFIKLEKALLEMKGLGTEDLKELWGKKGSR